ncbi:anthranilate phosphoribosyltransferase [Malassezia equina]|uniref:Anthranilate phosphoribosyltransferase n=1 Tax=Malassezia equina TaxID=1381935 RepID=A0AAF0EF16_9BASI|nr:anthranilate phosphoribosyltransferase [Malassezia equina]
MPHSLATFKPLVSQLVQSLAVPPPPSGKMRSPAALLTQDQLEALLLHLTDVDFTSNPAHFAQIGAALTALRMSGLDREPSTLVFMRHSFLEQVAPIALPELPASPHTDYRGWVDIVGTGGDGQDTFNVSTTASFVAAGVEGMHVCKHGGKASSSSSGSAELLFSLGLPLLDVPATQAATLLGQSACTFFLAPLFHRAMMPLAPIRSALGFPTLFNILGPLMNPARPQRGVYGVHSSGLGPVYAETLQRAGMEHFWVVCGQEGLDEISPAGPTDVWELRNGVIEHRIVTPEDFGLPLHPLEEVRSGTAAQNAAVVLELFTLGKEPAPGPLTEARTVSAAVPGTHVAEIPAGTYLRALWDYTLLQAAALLYVAGHGGGDPCRCTALARESLIGGGAMRALTHLRTLMHQLSSFQPCP